MSPRDRAGGPGRVVVFVGGVAGAILAVAAGFAVQRHHVPSPHAARLSATERVLLPAPSATAPTSRGVFLKDPLGQVERIAAGGRLVAWSVRTPADRTVPDENGPVGPVVFPASSKIVVVDERGGAPLTIDLGRRWVDGLRMFRGPHGTAEPQLAVRSCRQPKRKGCQVELYTLTPRAPLRMTAHSGGILGTAAYAGRIDSGRDLLAGPPPSKRARDAGTACGQPLSVRTFATGATQPLPKLPARDPFSSHCIGPRGTFLFGRYAFATIERSNPKYGFVSDHVYGIDTSAGAAARWHEVQTPYRYTPGSTGYELGPGVTDAALVYEETDGDGGIDSLERVLLPGSLTGKPTGAAKRTTADPIAPNTPNACDVAATDAAIYELANPRCAYDSPQGNAGEIRRITNPGFHVDVDG